MAKLIRALELHCPMIQFVPCYSFIIGAMFFGYSNLLLVHLRLEHRRNVFTVRMVEPTALQGWCCYQGKIKGQCFQGNYQKHRKKNKVVTLMVFKNVLRNKSLAEIKENCTLDGRSYCDVLTCYMVYPVGLSGNLQHPLSPPPPPPPSLPLAKERNPGN